LGKHKLIQKDRFDDLIILKKGKNSQKTNKKVNSRSRQKQKVDAKCPSNFSG
jgi:hypothetical protein